MMFLKTFAGKYSVLLSCVFMLNTLHKPITSNHSA
jgi:hypothetical protein